jgi:fructokinase
MKMNDAEVPQVLALLGIPGEEGATVDNLRLGAERMLAEFPTLQLVAITCGAHGSLLVTREEWHRHPGFPIEIADTIGAGDAFTAAIAHYLLRGAELALLNEAGNRWGSWVASQSGAMPSLSEATLAEIDTAIERSA